MFASLFDARAESFFITETVLQGMAPRAVGWRPAFSTDGLVSVSGGSFFRTILPASRSMRHFVRVLTTAGLVGYRSVNRVGHFLSELSIRTSSVIFKIIDVETSGAGMLVRPSISRTFVMADLSAGISDKEGELLRQLPFTVSCPRLVDPEASSPFSVGAVRRRHRCRHRGIP